MTAIYTIGYEGATVEGFLAALVAAGVDTLVDVRALPLSRKRGFSKNALSRRLREAGLEYVHMPDLGNPPKGREAAKAGKLKKFHQIYLSHFKSKETRKAFEALVSLGHARSLCMMCFERDPRICHRDIIAKRMKGRKFVIVDLFADDLTRHERPTGRLQSGHSREGATAAE
jgi:uncharacterized protein (DUF488 family)